MAIVFRGYQYGGKYFAPLKALGTGTHSRQSMQRQLAATYFFSTNAAPSFGFACESTVQPRRFS